MRIFILLSLFITLFFGDELKYNITIVLSVCWLLYTVYYYFNLKSIKDEKIVTDKCCDNPPNNNKSYYVRYLYNAKADYKAFFSMIIELVRCGSISLIGNNNTYYFINNKVKDEKLSKSEEYLKKILFLDIGSNDKISLENIKNVCRVNSGYISSVFKEWQNIFLYESAFLKYFKSVKPVVDNSLFYFVVSMIIAVFNIFFTGLILVSLIVFTITTLLIKSVNDYSNRESDATKEYICWLEFKNYLSKKEVNCDIKTLEDYAMYGYVLNEYDSIKEVLNRMYAKNIKIFDDNEILYMINLNIFDIIEKEIKDSIESATFKSTILFSKNKGK